MACPSIRHPIGGDENEYHLKVKGERGGDQMRTIIINAGEGGIRVQGLTTS